MKARDRLRIAVQRSGRLAEPARQLLARAGLSFRSGGDRLFCVGESDPVDLLLVRDDDIPALLAEGVCDLGIVGRNVLLEYRASQQAARPVTATVHSDGANGELRALGFGVCRLALAVPLDFSWQGPASLRGMRIATAYPKLLSAWLQEPAIEARVVVLGGSVEIAPRLGKADAICDLVSSGATLRANQLREVAALLDSEAVLAGSPEPLPEARVPALSSLLRRLDSVQRQRDSRLLMLQAPRSALPEILKRLPDGEAPSVTCVEGSSDQIALQAVCRGAVSWQSLEEIKLAGAHSLLVLPVERMLA